MRSLFRTIKLALIENIFARKTDIRCDPALVSFTFDDAPISAAENGARILEHHGVRGTFYVTLGLEAPSMTDRKFIHGDEISRLHETGHEIGCHTHKHIDIGKTDTQETLRDCRDNIAAIKSILGDKISVDNFAYPFGSVKLQAKKKLSGIYQTLRSTEFGINSRGTDLSFLRSVCLYSTSFRREHIEDTLARAIDNKAWLIFHTHDVSENPSKWGIGVNEFDWLVQLCLSKGCRIVPIGSAYRLLAKES
jgi:peptidoglycan/xylan/chitin deacetylase (PgdA/CDA1 family)